MKDDTKEVFRLLKITLICLLLVSVLWLLKQKECPYANPARGSLV